MSHFAHLHLHTQYSMLDGAIKIKELIAKAKELGQKAVAVTDHGVMHGVVEFYSEAIQNNIRPVIGCEVYITAGSRFEKKHVNHGGEDTHHLTLLAKDLNGYRNLCRLVTSGYTEGFYFKPRIDFDILSQFHEGLICLSGCVAGELASYTTDSNEKEARTIIERYATLFGNRYFLEVQPHAFKEQQLHNTMLKTLGNKLGIPLVATNDCHYLNSDDHHAQEVLMCISTGKLITDETRIKHEHSCLHCKTAEEMIQGLPSFEDAIWRSGEIADGCFLEFDFKKHYMPKFETDSPEPIDEIFEKQAQVGLKKRFEELEKQKPKYLSAEMRKQYQERLDFEIVQIKQMGFAGYFLVVSDFILWAKNNQIPVGPGRGSAAGSLVAYAMYITEIDPIPYKLLFERFLNPERVSLPDIDIDFCIYGRDKVIDYVSNKYGKDKVAQIATFGTLKAKAAIKDVGRALGLSYAETDRIAKLIPAPRQGFDYPIADALKMEKKLKEYADGEGKELITLAQKLEGLSRHTSTHAAGIVIGDRPIVELLPLMMDKDQQVVTQLSMNWVEKIGLVKFDFLGLKTLTVIQDAVRMIKENKNIDIDINHIPLEDQKTYKLVSQGNTIGVFQLESSGITEMVSRLKPNCFEDIVAILALYRPGPLDSGMADHYINRKHGREVVKYVHPVLEPVLKDTYGIILYQEQIMQIARDMANYSLAEADMLRRAMGKKKPEEMAKQREFFLSGAKKKGIAETIAKEVFDQMETFARYGFNRSHSVAYAMISYQTAYLKTHYPDCFMAALMTHEMGDTDKTLKNINECKDMGIEVLPPDVNKGKVGFNVIDNKIIFGLAAIKAIGGKVVDKLMECRQLEGEFKSLFDFCARLDSSVLNRRSLENFIKAGAFDWTKDSRELMFDILEETLKNAQKEKERLISGQIELFAGLNQTVTTAKRPSTYEQKEWPINIKLAHEKEALGFYLSGHPLEKFKAELKRLGTQTINEIKNKTASTVVTVAGVITILKLKNTKKGDRYASFVLEDMLDTIEVLVWPDNYQKYSQLLNSDDPVIITGKLDINEDRCTLIVNTMESAISIREKTAKEAYIKIDENKFSEKRLDELKNILGRHSGGCQVKLVICKADHSEVVISLPQEIKISPSEMFCNTVEQLFGEPVVSFR